MGHRPPPHTHRVAHLDLVSVGRRAHVVGKQGHLQARDATALQHGEPTSGKEAASGSGRTSDPASGGEAMYQAVRVPSWHAPVRSASATVRLPLPCDTMSVRMMVPLKAMEQNLLTRVTSSKAALYVSMRRKVCVVHCGMES